MDRPTSLLLNFIVPILLLINLIAYLIVTPSLHARVHTCISPNHTSLCVLLFNWNHDVRIYYHSSMCFMIYMVYTTGQQGSDIGLWLGM